MIFLQLELAKGEPTTAGPGFVRSAISRKGTCEEASACARKTKAQVDFLFTLFLVTNILTRASTFSDDLCFGYICA
jgi:hypothetical protein